MWWRCNGLQRIEIFAKAGQFIAIGAGRIVFGQVCLEFNVLFRRNPAINFGIDQVRI
jgi:hypothetical protein